MRVTKTFDWAGHNGDVWAEEWRRTDRSFVHLSPRLDAAILAAAPEQGSAIDIGCGAGGTAMALAARRPDLAVTGIDLSSALVEVARERAAGVPNLAFEVADAQGLGEARADLLFSRHGVMFFDDPVAGFAALRAAAVPGAKLVFSCFRARADNEWALVVDAAVGNPDPAPSPDYVPGPFGLADPAFTADVLARAGWHGEAQAIDFAYVAGAGVDPIADALDFFSRIGSGARAMADATPERRAVMRDSLGAVLADHVDGDAVTFAASAWIWVATAREPA